MVRFRTVVLVLIVIGVLIGGYWALIGFKHTVPDFINGSTSSDALDGDPTAYVTFNIEVAYSVIDYDCEAVLVKHFTGNVEDFQSFDQGRVYSSDKLTLLAVEETVGYLMFKVQVSKPGFTSAWDSGQVALMGYYGRANDDYSFETGRCFLPEKGTYSASLTVTFVPVDGGASSVEAQKTVTFEVVL